MDKHELTELLNDVAAGRVTAGDAALKLKMQPFLEISDYAKVDMHRGVRQGVPEVIFGAGKTKEHILGIAQAMLKNGQETVLVTRLSEEAAEYVGNALPLDYNKLSRTGVIGTKPALTGKGKIVVATGGTSDIPVAEEAAVTAETLGNEVIRLYDVGVSGIHRLMSHLDIIMSARDRRRCGDGGRAAKRHRRSCRLPGHRRSHQRRLRRVAGRYRGAAVHAQLLRKRRIRCQYR